MFVLALSSLALVWIYLLYPVVVRGFSKLYPSQVTSSLAYQPATAIIVPTVDEQAHIQEKLSSLLELDYPSAKLEIIVVDDGSADKTCEVVRQFESAGVKLVARPIRTGKTDAILAAAQTTSAEIILITDVGCVFDSDSLKNAISCFADPSVGAVTCALEPSEKRQNVLARGNRIYWQLDSQIKIWESSLHSVVGAIGAFLAVRRSLLVSFDIRQATGADDSDLSYHVLQNRMRVVMAPAANVLENPPLHPRHYFAQKVRISTQNIGALFKNLSLISRTAPWYGLLIFPSRRLAALLSPFLIVMNIISSLAVFGTSHSIALVVTVFWAASLLLALGGLAPGLDKRALPQIALMGWLMNAAISVGWLHYLTGKRYLIWDPLPR